MQKLETDIRDLLMNKKADDFIVVGNENEENTAAETEEEF